MNIQDEMRLKYQAALRTIAQNNPHIAYDAVSIHMQQLATIALAPGSIPEKLVLALQDFVHCGDYGTLWWNAREGAVVLTLGDIDGMAEYGFSDFDQMKKKLKAIPGVKSVEVYDEYTPIDDALNEMQDSGTNDGMAWLSAQLEWEDCGIIGKEGTKPDAK